MTTEKKSVTYTAAEEPVELDAFVGTWACDSLKFIFDGKGVVTNENGTSVAYTISNGKAKFSIGVNDCVCTLNGNTMTVDYNDGEYTFSKTFTKQAGATEETDGLEGTYKADSNVIVLDGKGNGTYNGTAFTYTLKSGSVYSISNFSSFDCGNNTMTVVDGGLKVYISDSYQEEFLNATFTKQ